MTSHLLLDQIGPSVMHHATPPEDLREAAIAYAKQGFRVIPIWWVTDDLKCACGDVHCTAPGKHPLITTGKRLKNASSDVATVDRWWTNWPTANVAIALDPGLVVIDCDLDQDDPACGWVDFLNWCAGWNMEPPDTLAADTGGGGVHYVLANPTGISIKNGTGVLCGVDVKTEGGYTLVAPSVHASGGVYAWRDGVPITSVRNMIGANVPLLTRLAARRSSSSGSSGTGGGAGMSTDDYRRVKEMGHVKKGERDEFFNRRAFELKKAGWTRENTMSELRETWERGTEQPPGDEFAWETVKEKIDRIFDDPDIQPNPGLDPALVAWARGDARDDSGVADTEVAKRLLWHRADREARRILDAEEVEAARGPRPKRTAREYADVSQPAAVISDVLAAEVNLLGGPSEAGKSLLARDWALCVATQQPWRGYLPVEIRNVLVVASEGMHDFKERWTKHPLWERAADRVYVLDEPVDVVRGDDVDWLLDEYAEERPGLVIFDVIYGMGMPDDNGTKDVGPVIAAMKRISAAWQGATLALGHPGHNGERRFRGSSMWRQLAAVEWHMADGRLTCKKSKIVDKRRLAVAYVAEYPKLRWLSTGETVAQESDRRAAVVVDIERHPDDSDRERALRLAAAFGVGERHARRLVKAYRPVA